MENSVPKVPSAILLSLAAVLGLSASDYQHTCFCNIRNRNSVTQEHLHRNHNLHLVQVVAAVCFVPLTSSSHSISEDSVYVPRDIFFLRLWFTALLASCFFPSQHTCDLWSLKKEVCLLPPLLLKRMSYALRKHRAAKWERKRRSERDTQPM